MTDNEPEELDDSDEGLSYRQFEHHKIVSEELNIETKPEMENNFTKVEIQDVGEYLEEDLKDQDQGNSKPQCSNSDNDRDSKVTNPEEDDGSWILDLIDLSGLENWPEHLQTEAKEMLKRNAKTFSKNDLDLGRTNLVKHHTKLTDHVPFKEAYRRIPLQMYDEVKADIQEMLDLGTIRPSNSP